MTTITLPIKRSTVKRTSQIATRTATFLLSIFVIIGWIWIMYLITYQVILTDDVKPFLVVSPLLGLLGAIGFVIGTSALLYVCLFYEQYKNTIFYMTTSTIVYLISCMPSIECIKDDKEE